jgi:hypothetical protein
MQQTKAIIVKKKNFYKMQSFSMHITVFVPYIHIDAKISAYIMCQFLVWRTAFGKL